MKTQKWKNMTIALVLTITFVLATANMPVINAQVRQESTVALISLCPNPAGVNQRVHVRMWVDPFPPTATDRYHGFQYTITKPDGTVLTGGPFTSDANGAYDFDFIPDQVGEYRFYFKYPGEQFAGGKIIRSSSEAQATLTVQQEKIAEWSEAPLPTYYWKRPISAEFREWWWISGNWLMGGYDASGRFYADAAAFNPYTKAPRAPHIVWTKEAGMGGLIGGEYGTRNYYPGIQYDSLVSPPIIINGKLYYRLFSSLSGAPGRYKGFVCVDLLTGEELWRNMTGNIDLGQIYVSMGYNGQGGRAFLWDTSSTSWVVYDAWSGQQRWMLTGALSSAWRWVFYGPNGDIYAYFTGGTADRPWLLMWNSTRAWERYGWFSGGTLRNDRPGTFDWKLGIQWNVTVPSVTAWGFGSPSIFAADPSSGVLVLAASPPDAPNSGLQVQMGYDAMTGALLWIANRTFQGTLNARYSCGEGMLVMMNMQTMRRSGFDLKTGKEIWLSDPTAAPWGMYTSQGKNAYGKAYSGAYDGYMRAFDLKTGKQVWEYFIGNSGLETPYGTWPVFNGPLIGDHVVFCGYSEHTPNTPLYRGASLVALDSETGEELWKINAWLSLRALSDGYLVTVNAYDNQIYVIGKGPSATTVSASPAVLANKASVLIQGTVTDQSPGAKEYALAARFPNGVPAVADESMSAWMEYLYMQKPMPQNIKGVWVTFDAIAPNGTWIHIGGTHTDSYGMYSVPWTPPSEGLWTIIATFPGSESYWPSYAETTIHVTVAPPEGPAPATAEQVAEQAETMQSTLQSAIEALQPWNTALTVLVVIAIVIGVVNLYALRKRK